MEGVFDQAMDDIIVEGPGVTGVLCTDYQGLCLGVRGKACSSSSGVIANIANKVSEIEPSSTEEPVIFLDSNNLMTSGNLNDLDIHPRILSVVKKAGFTNAWKILENSMGELRTKTGLSALDSKRLMKEAAQQCLPLFTTGWRMLQDELHSSTMLHIKTGCCKVDDILGGGIPCKGITEIAGESGSGKTQLALQVALQCQLPVDSGGLGKGVAYICTETHFPVSRLNQLVSFRTQQKTFNGKKFSDNIYVHHLPDMDNLVDCIRYQLPQFTTQKGVGLIIIDSVAAAFRSSEERQEVKSKMVQQLGFRLHQLEEKQKVAVLAINQVTATFGDVAHGMMEDNLVPALGLSWANLVTTRIMLRKTYFAVSPQSRQSERNETQNINPTYLIEDDENIRERCPELSEPEMRVRTLDVVFCPWLARKSSPFTVTEEGIKDIDPSSMRVLDQF